MAMKPADPARQKGAQIMGQMKRELGAPGPGSAPAGWNVVSSASSTSAW